jgi:hypothetical protein
VTLQECTALLAPLALAMRTDLDEPTFKAYHRVLRDVPAHLAASALDALTQEGLRFFPTAIEIQGAAERVRRALLAAHPYEGCVECDHQRGYRTIAVNGQKTVGPCPCKARHRAKLERLGVADPIAALPGEAGTIESEQVYPTLEQLPGSLQKQIREAVGRKLLR